MGKIFSSRTTCHRVEKILSAQCSHFSDATIFASLDVDFGRTMMVGFRTIDRRRWSDGRGGKALLFLLPVRRGLAGEEESLASVGWVQVT